MACAIWLIPIPSRCHVAVDISIPSATQFNSHPVELSNQVDVPFRDSSGTS